MRRLLCALIFLAIVQSIQSQSGKVTISGLVVNEKFRTPIPFVNVTLKIGNNDSTLVGMITTEDGRFSIPGIGPGNYAMEFSYVGFQSRKLSVLVGQLNDF
ncbi:MAG TPA: carboxypeptidase regulatory-like domain-containing protein, partial [Flavitalea sp.]|nr:carboxypeptidase regulatory-like domain-containing protein [Flavitalea sp.]